MLLLLAPLLVLSVRLKLLLPVLLVLVQVLALLLVTQAQVRRKEGWRMGETQNP